MDRMKGKVCVVTGGVRGIGRGIVETFAREGALRIWALDMNAQELESLEKAIPCVKGVVMNVTDGAAVEAFVVKAKAEYGRVDVLVNNAGITKDALIHKMTESDWDAVINVLLKVPFLMTKYIAPVMMETGSGSIVSMPGRRLDAWPRYRTLPMASCSLPVTRVRSSMARCCASMAA